MKINKVGSLNPITSLTNGISESINKHYNFHDALKFTELGYDALPISEDEDNSLLVQILACLMQDVVLDGCAIATQGRLGNNEIIIEASFIPPRNKKPPIIYIPLPLITQQLGPINHLLKSQRENVLQQIKELTSHLALNMRGLDLIKLIILLAHEYGHFISFQRGCHDSSLKLGLNLMATNVKFSGKADYYAYAIFSEELAAWRTAEIKLKSYGFTAFEYLEKVKYQSLQAYYYKLNLNESRIETYTKLSMLNVDLEKLNSTTSEK